MGRVTQLDSPYRILDDWIGRSLKGGLELLFINKCLIFHVLSSV